MNFDFEYNKITINTLYKKFIEWIRVVYYNDLETALNEDGNNKALEVSEYYSKLFKKYNQDIYKMLLKEHREIFKRDYEGIGYD